MKHLITALKKVIAQELKINDRQKRMVTDEKGIGFYPMTPMDFLKLTAPPAEIKKILENAKTVEFYNEAGSVVHPFLNFDAADGKVHGHEGRHRAAAVHKEGGDVYQVALFPYPKHRQWELEDLPTTLKGQFTNDTLEIDYDKIEWAKFNLANYPK